MYGSKIRASLTRWWRQAPGGAVTMVPDLMSRGDNI